MHPDKELLWESSDALPEKVAALGAPAAEFNYHGQWLTFTLAFAAVAAIFGFFAVLARDWTVSLALIGLAGLWWLLVTVQLFRERHFRLVVYAEGLALWEADRLMAYAWHEIATVERRTVLGYPLLSMALLPAIGVFLVRGFTRTLVLRGGDGGEIVVRDSVPNFKLLTDLVQAATWNHLWPAALDTLQAGRPVLFGELTVSRDGLGNGRETLAWEEVRKIKFDEDSVAVMKKGKWFPWYQSGSAGVPNLPVFVALTDYVRSNAPV